MWRLVRTSFTTLNLRLSSPLVGLFLHVPVALAQTATPAPSVQTVHDFWRPRVHFGAVALLAQPLLDTGATSPLGYGLGFTLGVGFEKLPVIAGANVFA